MNSREANVFLTRAAVIDPLLKPDVDRAVVWAELLDDVTLEDALAALKQHYRAVDVKIMPSHVLQLVAEIQEERAELEAAAREERALMLEAFGRAGVTEEEYLAHEHDVAWLREKFAPRVLEGGAE